MPGLPGTNSLLAMFPALSERWVRRYFLGQASSVLGIWVQNITLNLLVWELSESPATLGVLNFLLWGPGVLITPVVGPYATTASSRKQVALTVGGALLVSLLFLGLSLAGLLTVTLALGLALLRGILSGIEVPGRQVLLTSSVVDRTKIGNAVAMNAMVYNMARMVGPAIAAVIFGLVGAGWGFAVSALAMALMLWAVLSMPTPVSQEPVREPGSERPGLKAAIAHVRSDRFSSLFLPVAFCLAILGGSYSTLVPVLADRVFGSAHTYTGLFFSAAGLGSTCAALLLSSRFLYAASRRLQVVTPWTVVLALLVLGLSNSPTFALGAFAVLGFSMTFTGPGTNAKLHQNAPQALRGALVGLYALSFTGAIPVGNLLSGFIAQWFSVQTTFLLMAGSLAIGLGVLFVPRWIAHGRIVIDADRI
jgi:MFS family permease